MGYAWDGFYKSVFFGKNKTDIKQYGQIWSNEDLIEMDFSYKKEVKGIWKM